MRKEERTVTCKFCGECRNYIPIEVSNEDLHLLDCRFCGANLATGKIEDDFIYVWSQDLQKLKELVNKIRKLDYKPIGKLVIEDCRTWSKYIQAMIKKEQDNG